MTDLVLVRHGQASFGARRYDRLSTIGEQQATLLGLHWKQCIRNWDRWVSGEMERQTETARLAAEGCAPGGAVTVNSAFNEYDADSVIRAYLPQVAKAYPEFAMTPAAMMSDPKLFQRFFEKIIGAWLSGTAHDGPSVESWAAFRSRCMAGLEALGNDPQRRSAVLFTSGGVITVALQAALHLDDATAFSMNWRIRNASVHTFKWGRRGLHLDAFNDVSHLQLARDPALHTFR